MHLIDIHPQNPQQRLLAPIINAHTKGATVVIPSESGYLLALPFSTKLSTIAGVSFQTPCLLCSSISQASGYAHIDNDSHRTLKSHLADTSQIGQMGFVLPASKQTPKTLRHKDTITIAFSAHPIVIALTEQQPLWTVTLGLDTEDIERTIKADYFIHVGDLPCHPVTVIDLT